VNVIGTHMGGQQAPLAIGTTLDQGGEHGLPTVLIHGIRRLGHNTLLRPNPIRIGLDQPASW